VASPEHSRLTACSQGEAGSIEDGEISARSFDQNRSPTMSNEKAAQGCSQADN
jgi:hypothetical protein